MHKLSIDWRILFLNILLVHKFVRCSAPDEEFGFTVEKIPEHCGRNAFDSLWIQQILGLPHPPSERLTEVHRRSQLQRAVINKRIVGGTITRFGEWPWLVSVMHYQTARQVENQQKSHARGIDLLWDTILDEEDMDVKVKSADVDDLLYGPPSLVYNYPDGARRFHLCGGTLIHPQWILTAAHCFQPNEQYPDLSVNPQSYIMRIGEHDMLNDTIEHYDMEVAAIIKHPNYEPIGGGNDVALVKLIKPVHLGKYVNIACLPNINEKLVAGMECLSVGWGHEIEKSMNISTILKHVSVQIVPNDQCFMNYATLRTGPNPVEMEIKNNMICAGHPKGGRDACQFDSGGPLMCYINNQWIVAGIISFGYGCGKANYPGVYTRVSDFLPWIQTVANLMPD